MFNRFIYRLRLVFVVVVLLPIIFLTFAIILILNGIGRCFIDGVIDIYEDLRDWFITCFDAISSFPHAFKLGRKIKDGDIFIDVKKHKGGDIKK